MLCPSYTVFPPSHPPIALKFWLYYWKLYGFWMGKGLYDCMVCKMIRQSHLMRQCYFKIRKCFSFFRQVPVNQGREKAPVNGHSPLHGFLPHHQQIILSGKQDNSASTEETSASSGMCQCRCTCGGQCYFY